MSRELREESAALHALGLLAGEELIRFRRECREDQGLHEFSVLLRDVSAQLVHLAPSECPPVELRERLLRGIGRASPRDQTGVGRTR
jgi:hypothetical protein